MAWLVGPTDVSLDSHTLSQTHTRPCQHIISNSGMTSDQGRKNECSPRWITRLSTVHRSGGALALRYDTPSERCAASIAAARPAAASTTPTAAADADTVRVSDEADGACEEVGGVGGAPPEAALAACSSSGGRPSGIGPNLEGERTTPGGEWTAPRSVGPRASASSQAAS